MSKQIIVNNLLISYNLIPSKTPTSKTLIFLHGWMSNKEVWNEVIERIKDKNLNIFALDLPGFGDSQKPMASMQISDYSDILTEFINKLKLKNIVLVGHSFGGAVAIKFASKKPSGLLKVILVNASGIRLKREKTTLLALGAKLLSPLFSLRFLQPLKRMIYRVIGNEDYLDSGEMKLTYLNVIGEDLSPILNEIEAPTLIVWGEKDKDTPLWMANKLNENIKNSKLNVIAGAGHYSFLERPKDFIEILGL